MSTRGAVGLGLAGLATSLLIVGLLSGTVTRHVVQIIPAVLILAALRSGGRWPLHAALPVCTLWLLLMMMIWVTLAGVANPAPGTYSTGERVLTVTIAGSAILGGAASIKAGAGVRIVERIAAWALFAILQVAALWASFATRLVHD